MQQHLMNTKQTEENISNKNVFVGISGGVDSSVAAFLLKKEGYNVTGVFIKIWHPELIGCDWKDEMRDAMRVCAHLEIPFKMIDLAEVYKEKVIQYMIDSYNAGFTPNPDVMCNTHVKFGVFYDWAIENGANFVATGHYAQIKDKDGKKYLYSGIDEDKDQSYFLWNINKKCLANTIFPIGKFTKKEVRNIAKKNNIPTADKPDSQGLCFIGDVDLKSFLKKKINIKKGDVLDLIGNKIGFHDGASLYTLGERHGFKVNSKNSEQEPLYVLDRDIEKNIIIVGEKRFLEENTVTRVVLKGINLLTDSLPNQSDIVYRYHGKKNQAEIVSNKDDQIIIELEKEITKPAIGQSVVFYKDGFCLGGGVIQ